MYAGQRGERRGLVMENLMSECLDVAVRVGDDPDSRSRKAILTAAWSLLEKRWKAVLMVALRKEELPERDEDGKVKQKLTRRSRQRSKGPRRRITGTGADSWLESVDTVLQDGLNSPYRLAVLLIHRARMADNWKSENDEVVVSLRKECVTGVHPVWSRLARETPLLAEFAEYPSLDMEQAEVIEEEWLNAALFDPVDLGKLAAWLNHPAAIRLPTETSLAIQRLAQELDGKGGANILENSLPEALDELVGGGALIAGMLFAASGDERCNEAFDRASKDNASMQDIAMRQKVLAQLRSGDDAGWLPCAKDENSDGLATARLTTAWSRAVPETENLDVEDLRRGIEHLELVSAKVPEALRWRLVEAVDALGDADSAAELTSDAKIADDEAFIRALKLASHTNSPALNTRLLNEVKPRNDSTLFSVVKDLEAPATVRSEAANELLSRNCVSEAFDDLLTIFINGADAVRLASTLVEVEESGIREPYATLLAWHLLPASVEPLLYDKIKRERRAAQAALNSALPRPELSELATALTLLLNGSNADLEAIQRAAEKHGISSMREARRAMMENGDGLLRNDRINKLSDSIAEASLTQIEARLFENLVIALRLNRAANDLQSGDDEKGIIVIEILNSIVQTNLPARYLSTIEDLVIEYEVPLPALATWYRVNRPTSPFSTVVNAAIQQAAGDRLRAARAYQEAAPHFDFEQATILYRKALISFALAGRWPDAVDLLDKHPELAAAVTRRFQLYLRVSDEFLRDQERSGRGKRGERHQARKILLDFVDELVPAHPDEHDDQVVAAERRGQKEEALDILSNYPEEHNLPLEPFVGRVRSATRQLARRRRSRRDDQERRLRDALNDGGTPLEIVEIANDAADDEPIRGLRMLERALNDGKFRPREMMALREAQQAIFTQHQPEIKIRNRRQLRNLSLTPLVLVDTNMLIDALKARVQRLLAMEDMLPHPSSARAFHRMLKFRSDDGRIRLYIPSAAKNEFMHRVRSPNSVLDLFGEHDPYIDGDVWAKNVTQEAVNGLGEEIIQDFSNWVAPKGEDFNNTVQSYKEAVEKFLIDHREIYLNIDSAKRQYRRHIPQRTELGGDEIYPEAGDLDILRTAATLADSAMREIGSVLIATRDADFELVDRALEETFGIGVVKNAQQFSRWMN